MIDTWKLSHTFILSLKEGDVFYLGNKKHSVTKRTPFKISLSIDGKDLNVLIKNCDEFFYFHSRGIKVRNHSYPLVSQLLRDIEGYIVYLMNIHFFDKKEKMFKEILERNLTNQK